MQKELIPGGCQLCAFRGCDGDFCRHGAHKDDGYAVCNATRSLFDPQLLIALSSHPIKGALFDAPGVWEPGVSQVYSRLDHRLTVAYGGPYRASAHVVIDRLADLNEPCFSDFGFDYSDELAVGAPECLKKAAAALVSQAGFRIVRKVPDYDGTAGGLMASMHLVRGRKLPQGSLIGIDIDLSFWRKDKADKFPWPE